MSAQGSLWEAERAPYVRPTMREIRARRYNGLKVVSTFSGCGGSSLGLRMAGYYVPYAVEFIPAAADTYQANFPDTYVDRRDIREVKGEEILNRLALRSGELDVFEGSPPCASFSSAGMRERGWGKEKKYSDTTQRTDDLFWEWARLLEDLNPRAFVAENVPGLTMGNALDDYARKITGYLGGLGYRVASRVLNSAHYGVPQDRRRLIFLGLREDVSEVPPTFPAPTVGEPVTLRQALESVTWDDPDDVAGSSMEGKAVGRTWEWLKGKREKDDCARCGRSLSEHTPTVRTVGAVKRTAGAGGEIREQRGYACADGERAVEVKDYFMLTVPELDAPCPTLTATGAGVGAASVVHPEECRKFTPAEALAVCGFPPDFTLTGTREQRYERMGRAVSPPLYEAVGRHIMSLLAGS